MESSESYGATKSNAETSQADFKALVLRHKAMLWHICSNYSIGSAWNTEDCMQEVMINLWRSFGTFEKRSSEKTWVWRIATNTMLMLRRKDVRSPQTEPFETFDVEDKADGASSEHYQQLQQLINTLPEESNMIIRAFLDGFSYKEIAEMTGSSVGAVAMRIARTNTETKNIIRKRKRRMTMKNNIKAMKQADFKAQWQRCKQWQDEAEKLVPDDETFLQWVEKAQQTPGVSEVMVALIPLHRNKRWIPYAAAASIVIGVAILGLTRSAQPDKGLPMTEEVTVESQTIHFICNNGRSAQDIMLRANKVIK